MTREEQLVEAFVEAADTLVDDFDVIEFLHTLARRCVQLLDLDAAGLMLADSRGQLRATAASTESARLLEMFELQADADPCLDAFRTGAQVVNADLQANQKRWPRFAEAAQATGFVSVHALPLRLRATIIGALNLFVAHPGALSAADVRTRQALADVATIGIPAQRSLHQSELLNVQLQQALSSRVTIEQAKGVLAERRQITVDAASPCCAPTPATTTCTYPSSPAKSPTAPAPPPNYSPGRSRRPRKPEDRNQPDADAHTDRTVATQAPATVRPVSRAGRGTAPPAHRLLSCVIRCGYDPALVPPDPLSRRAHLRATSPSALIPRGRLIDQEHPRAKPSTLIHSSVTQTQDRLICCQRHMLLESSAPWDHFDAVRDPQSGVT